MGSYENILRVYRNDKRRSTVKTHARIQPSVRRSMSTFVITLVKKPIQEKLQKEIKAYIYVKIKIVQYGNLKELAVVRQ